MKMKKRLPKLAFHKVTGWYYIYLDGKQKYLDRNKDKAECMRIDILRQIPSYSHIFNDPESIPTVEQAATRWLKTIQAKRTQTKTYSNPLQACRVLINVCDGHKSISDLNRTDFAKVRTTFGTAGHARSTANARIGCLKQLFKWLYNTGVKGIETAYDHVNRLNNFSKDESGMKFKESRECMPVPVEVVEKTLPFLPSVVRDMVMVQLHAGMRAGEVCNMTTERIDTSKETWLYTPKHHKTEHHGKKRVVYLGPKAQGILSLYMEKAGEPEEFLFSPEKSEKNRKTARRKARKSRVQPSQQNRSKQGAKRKPGKRYTKDSYSRAIARGCEKAIEAGVLLPAEKWHSHQLRHTAGTLARDVAGLDGAQVFLGHSNANVTQIYAERNDSLGVKIASLIG